MGMIVGTSIAIGIAVAQVSLAGLGVGTRRSTRTSTVASACDVMTTVYVPGARSRARVRTVVAEAPEPHDFSVAATPQVPWIATDTSVVEETHTSRSLLAPEGMVTVPITSLAAVGDVTLQVVGTSLFAPKVETCVV